MVALFSTLLSNASTDEVTSTSTSSSSIPTVIQLYTTNPLALDTTSKLAGHAILSYQAVEVHATASEETLFGRTRKSTSTVPENPNLGVWNAKVIKESALVDSLLKIPTSQHFCMTIDVTDPSGVEPAMTRMQEALVRYLIAYPNKEGSTNLYDLKLHTFGLAPEDESPTTSAAPDESDRNVCVNLMICAVRPASKRDDYKETQAQNLVLYHLRRYAAAIGATLVFVSTVDNNTDNDHDEAKSEEASLSLQQLGNVWRKFAQGSDIEEDTAVFCPDTNQDLIETVLLRNANCPGEWQASKDSLWKALPPLSQAADAKDKKAARSSGDDGWLQQLRDSLGSAAEPAAASTPSTTPKTEDAEVSSFFENLLKK
jgi:hypothetical protein